MTSRQSKCARGNTFGSSQMPVRGRRSSSRSDLKIVERIITVADVVVIIISILGEGVLGTQEGKGRGHGRVLVLERELARIRVRLYHCASNQAAVGRFSLRGVANNLGLDVLGDSLKPLGNRHLRGSGIGHVRNHRKLLDSGREDHLAHTTRAPLALLRVVRIRGGIHRRHGHLKELQVTIGRLNRCAKELEPPHVRSTLNLDALLAPLLDDLGHELGAILGCFLLSCRLWLLLRRGLLLLPTLLFRCLLLLASRTPRRSSRSWRSGWLGLDWRWIRRVRQRGDLGAAEAGDVVVPAQSMDILSRRLARHG
mmetsp:Transcript_11643/g.36102  ORF Transcript_11643/g.36102 Transcript_11643/m.36102 type:complete len:311 (+) Transcript_11643:444-1376(+)